MKGILAALLAALIAAWVLTASAEAAPKAGAGLRGLEAGVVRQSNDLGKAGARDLKRLAGVARSAYKKGNTCRSLRALGRFVSRTKRMHGHASELGQRARKLQLRVLRGAPAGKRCGLKAPKLRVDDKLHPAKAFLPGLDGGPPRPLARLVGSNGDPADFAEEELLVATASEKKLQAFLNRNHGKLLETTDPKGGTPVHLVRIDPSLGKPSGLATDLTELDPRAHGRLRVSSRDALGLLSIAADEATEGVKVGVNFVAEGEQFLDRNATEAAAGSNPPALSGLESYTANPFDWSYMKKGSFQNIGAAEAWRFLEIAGKLGNRTTIAVIDGGFASSADFSPASTGVTNNPNAMKCGGKPCPWHGTAVASTAAGVADNGSGVAGAAGPVADLRMITNDGTMFDAIADINDAVDSGARVINLSLSMSADAVVSFSLIPYEIATVNARSEGALVFAAAGNQGVDVDAEDCFVACWEEEWHAPCENNGVICVGGLRADSKLRHDKSNYGYESCEDPDCDVDIFAPFVVYTGPDPDNAANRVVNGTSFASPFAAGVAALIWAADPGLSDDGVEQLMMFWAHGGGDSQVDRYVNPQSSVWHALGADEAPFLKIDSPANGIKTGYGGLNIIEFKATVADIEDGDACCPIVWSSDVDGVFGAGSSLNHAFGSPGKRVVTASATDASGKTVTDTVVVDVGNSAPTVTIEKPKQNATLYKGALNKLVGSSQDMNEPGLALPCSSLEWTSKRKVIVGTVPGPSATGCQPGMTFTQAGTYTIFLTGTDSAGDTATASVQVKVVDPPLNAKPAPQITQPAEGMLDPNTTYSLKGVANEFDNDPLTWEWRLIHGSTSKVIGNAPHISWKPGDDVVGHCSPEDITIILKVTDKDGSGSDTASYSVFFPAC